MAVGVKGRTYGRIDGALQPCGRLSVGANGGLHVHRGYGVEKIEVNIVFAAPDNFDRLAELFREDGGFGDLIGFGLAPKPSTEQRDVAGYIFFLDAEHAGDGFLHGLRILGWRPGEHFSVAILGDGYWRLHGNVREVRSVISRLR